MKWTGHVTHIGEKINCGACDRIGACGVLVGDLMERDHLEGIDADRIIILKQIFKKWDGKAWTGLMLRRISTGGGRL
jgi:hypothetical protein